MTGQREKRGSGSIETAVIPKITRDRQALVLIAGIKSPEDIDLLVEYLRNGFFPRWLGYKPSMVIINPNLSKYMEEGIEQGLLKPEILPLQCGTTTLVAILEQLTL